MTLISRIVPALLVLVSLSVPAVAQTAITQADVQRLQDNVYLAERDVTQLRTRDAARATQIQAEVDELRDEVVYLKVKLRKERSLARSEYTDVRDRIEGVRTRARGDATASSAVPAAPNTAGRTTRTGAGGRNTINVAGATEVPSGTEIDVRLQSNLNSGTMLVEDRFDTTTMVDLVVDGRTVIPSGSVVRGVVTAVEPASRTNRTSRMTVSFDRVTVNNRAYPIRGTVTQALEAGGVRDEAGRTAAGAGVGAIIGAIIGGTKGAVLGGVIGAGGTIAATEGKDIDLPQGTILRVRLDSPVQIQAR